MADVFTLRLYHKHFFEDFYKDQTTQQWGINYKNSKRTSLRKDCCSKFGGEELKF